MQATSKAAAEASATHAGTKSLADRGESPEATATQGLRHPDQIRGALEVAFAIFRKSLIDLSDQITRIEELAKEHEASVRAQEGR